MNTPRATIQAKLFAIVLAALVSASAEAPAGDAAVQTGEVRPSDPAAVTHEIVGYFPSWKYDSRRNLVNTRTIPWEKYTIVNYAFFIPYGEGMITGVDSLSKNEDRILNGERDSVTGRTMPGTSLAAQAHAHGTKVMASLGGWEGSLGFSSIARSADTRARFAHSCMRLIERYGFDGIDIDWEYPGYKDHQGTPDDTRNFTLLLQALRDSLDARGAAAGTRYLLTAALPAGREHADNIEMKRIEPLLDLFNIMTYDCYGEWSPVSGHNSPLFGKKGGGDNGPSMDAAFRLYRDDYRISPAKINLGAAFYAHTFKNCTAIYTAHGGEDREHFAGEGFFYYEILARMGEFDRHWDETSQVPYLVGKRFPTLVSYDDERSMALKAQYVVDNHAAGLIVWELTGDYLEDGRTPLVDAIVEKFGGALRKTKK